MANKFFYLSYIVNTVIKNTSMWNESEKNLTENYFIRIVIYESYYNLSCIINMLIKK